MRRRPSDGPPRLPIDRVFSIKGFGTVVTGTLLTGRLAHDDELVLQPSGRMVKVRGLHVHGEAQEETVAGQRVAVNLAGVEVDGHRSRRNADARRCRDGHASRRRAPRAPADGAPAQTRGARSISSRHARTARARRAAGRRAPRAGRGGVRTDPSRGAGRARAWGSIHPARVLTARDDCGRDDSRSVAATARGAHGGRPGAFHALVSVGPRGRDGHDR